MAVIGPPAQVVRDQARQGLGLEEQLTHTVGTRVTIKPSRAKNSGRLIIDYYTLEDFDRITASLGLNVES